MIITPLESSRNAHSNGMQQFGVNRLFSAILKPQWTKTWFICSMRARIIEKNRNRRILGFMRSFWCWIQKLGLFMWTSSSKPSFRVLYFKCWGLDGRTHIIICNWNPSLYLEALSEVRGFSGLGALTLTSKCPASVLCRMPNEMQL